MPAHRKSLEVLKASGGYRKDRHEDRTEDRPDVYDNPTPPDWLDKDSRKLYRKLAKELIANGLFTALDTEYLAVYSKLYTQVRGKLESGEEVTGSHLAQIRSMSNDLALSPASRERLTIQKPQAKAVNPFLQFVK